MSRPISEAIPCPDCGKSQQFVTWSSLNVTLVETRNQLLEKIYIFEAGMDDRIVELAKVLVSSKLPPEHQGDQTELLFSGIAEEESAAKMKFSILVRWK